MSDLANNTGAVNGDAPMSPPEGMQPATPATGKVGGPPPNIQQLVASKRLQQAQAQVGEVVDIMRVNVEKVLERDQKISELDRRADDLQEGASQFQQQAVKLKRKYWWENVKMWLIIAIILLVVVIIVVVSTTGQRQALTTATVTDEVSNADSADANAPSDTGESLKSGGTVPQDSSGIAKDAAPKSPSQTDTN